jgi:hypothetical protein
LVIAKQTAHAMETNVQAENESKESIGDALICFHVVHGQLSCTDVKLLAPERFARDRTGLCAQVARGSVRLDYPKMMLVTGEMEFWYLKFPVTRAGSYGKSSTASLPDCQSHGSRASDIWAL